MLLVVLPADIAGQYAGVDQVAGNHYVLWQGRQYNTIQYKYNIQDNLFVYMMIRRCAADMDKLLRNGEGVGNGVEERMVCLGGTTLGRTIGCVRR